MRVCFISHSFALGGAERALLELIEALTSRGVRCYVILPWWGPLKRALNSRSVPSAVLPYLWWMGRTGAIFPRMGRTLVNLALSIPLAVRIARWRCDLIYTNTITVCVGAIAATLLRRPHVLHIHEFGYADQGLRFDWGEGLSVRILNRWSSAMIACSQAVARSFRPHVDPRKLTVVYSAVDIDRRETTQRMVEHTQSAPAIRCVLVGNLQPGKGQADAILAVATLMQLEIDAKLWLIGRATDSRYARYLQRLVADRGLEESVTFTGYVEHPFPFLQHADVVLMCSRREAFGRVSVEAMRAMKPVVGTRSAATVELIRDGWNGLLYSPGDHAELAEKIRYLYGHPHRARQMGMNGHRWAAQHCTAQQYGEAVLKVLRQCLSGASPPNEPLGHDPIRP